MGNENLVVTAEDQVKINQFARIYQQHVELKKEIETAEIEVANYSEAGDEILLLDSDDAGSVPFKIGQTFIHFDSDSLSERLEKLKEKAEENLAEKKRKNESILSEIESLKKILYGKFGDHINLEYDKDE